MVKKVESFVAHDGRIFLSEEAAVRYEAVERLCEVIPEFAMVRPRLEASLDAVASAMGPMVAYRARVPSKGPIGCCVNTPRGQDHHTDCPSHPDYDHAELAGTCDCAAGMNGSPYHHHRTCPSYRPVAEVVRG